MPQQRPFRLSVVSGKRHSSWHLLQLDRQIRKNGYPNIPESTGRTSKHKAVKQEVVKLDMLSDAPAAASSFQSGRFTSGTGHTGASTIEIHTGSSAIRMTNDIDSQLFCMVLSRLGGMR